MTPVDSNEKDKKMATFLLVYKGGGPMPATAGEQEASMKAWMSWFGSLGAAVKDGGNPFNNSAGVGSNGTVTEGATSGLTGYSLLLADDLAAATTMTKGCPILAHGGSVDVYEAFNVM